MAINQIGLSADQLAFDAKEIGKLQQGAKQNSPEAIKASAKQFEALFMNMIMKSMRDATPQDGLFDNSETKTYTAMMDQKVSENLAKRGVGLADVLFRQLSVVTSTPASGALNESTLDPSMMKPATPLKNSFEAGLPAMTVPVRKSYPAQPAHVKAFQDKLGAHAEEASRATGIPAKFMLGQAALETGWGKKEIIATDGKTSHNLFGIKAGAGWTGQVVEARTTEYVNGVAQSRIEKFRAYDSYADAFKDYGRLITNNPRYKNVMANVTDATGFAQGLQRAGYATDPLYATKLASIIKNSLLA
ncbi:flagellar assembly peptidoglycan hydrolase FlgJ [Actimicrobium sp. CCC2.4]|uniref:flagellar assembly peptidoglycan hydrolase FlgJ n=1 Tax=Actimicrobium sp. CCC2.4 TaxID=3048606 RepID=UPI002AC8B1AA|nr:flagellar assembly peptidoglycan hydrolase FlgJ [Actimicrobium sp. CCC2.4]MEB0135243.1 flagellar assembly peptidoglycan hydrolase FlgJ [Actimicrobium sp. CCC2.4]WPX31037.1 flagellar assembly peptidoglycan hydrolase FlgJ [Actimicrobium sp. CCC2.4]